MRRSRAEEPLPSNERWMLSWSDFVTLLLAVFAAMYAGASMDLVKANAVARSVGQALGAPVQPAAPARVAGNVSAEPGDRMEFELADELAGLGLGDKVRVLRNGSSVGIDIDADLLFAEGDARLSAKSGQLLADIAGVLRDKRCKISVEGHTDARPIRNSKFASNWELSAARAAMVVRALVLQGIEEQRLQAVGLASNEPLASNDSEQGRATNRRVHLLLLRL